ncbi:uncharacterized protein LOC131078405 isoform X2 [Cryptomeria japonica]|uniref:uncharacterized protein LOC131078405 isoform X2 n=1 Tax=Cryptomeria japonica TaxID=3369 RepID=UPI0027DAA8F3|nr:uncharacterized protein LOC131078405 isoform X2 [Cryptomeria japonica]
MEMWMVVAAAGSGYLANYWNRANRNKDLTDDGNLGPTLRTRNRTRNAPNSSTCQVEDNANPNKFGIIGGAFSLLSSEEEQSNAFSKSQVMENEAAHFDSKPGLANGKDPSGERIKQQEILQESHFGENPDMLANNFVGEFGFGRRYGSWKRGSSSFRGRGRVLRAAINKPMSSLESCLVNYEISDSSCISCGRQRTRQRQRPLLVTDGNKIVSRGAGISPLLLPIPGSDCGHSCHNDINGDGPEPAPTTGLPSLRKSSQSSRNAGMTKRRKTCGYNSSTLSAFESNKHFPFQGYLLVCFGVGIGIMSTVMSSRREMERLTCLLRQREELVEDLEEELEMRGSWSVKDLTDDARICLETWRNPLGKKQGQSDASLDALSNEACEVDGRASVRDPDKKMENMTSVEAELEAELEKLEFNLHSSKHQRKFPGINEIDPDCIADVVNGELREDGLMRNAESEEDNSSLIHDEFNTGNYSVSPRDLERRLHEVIISRLQDRIIELETELKGTRTKLQAVRLGQKQSNELSQTSQSLNSDPEVLTRTSGFLKNQIYLPADKKNSSKEYLKMPINQEKIDKLLIKELLEGTPTGDGIGSQTLNLTKVGCEDFNLQNIDVEDSNETKNLPLFLSLSGDALSAYTEAYDELMKMTLEKGTNMFASADVEDAQLSKQSVSVDSCHCYGGSESQQEDGKCFLHLERYPSLSTNFWNAGGQNACFSQGSSCVSGLQSFTSPKQMDLEFEGIALKSSYFPDNVVEDTSGSTPCSLKFVDTNDLINIDCDHYKSVGMNVATEPEKVMVNMDTLCRTDGSSSTRVSNLEGSQLPMPSAHQTCTGGKEQPSQLLDALPTVSTSVLDKTRFQGIIGTEEALEGDAGKGSCHQLCKIPGSLPTLSDNVSPTSDESDYSSEADDQLGTLLIKRIVEKIRQGCPSVQEAESMLASLD